MALGGSIDQGILFMFNTYLSKASSAFISGSSPSIFTETNDSTCLNLLAIDGVLAPMHGFKKKIGSIVGKISKIYKSDKSKNVYFEASGSLYQLDELGDINLIASIEETLGNIAFSENLNNEITITTGKAVYSYNYQTNSSEKVVNGLKITLPVHNVMVDTITFVFDGSNSTFQASKPNSSTDYTNDKTFVFETKPGNIVAAAVIDRTIFVIGENNIERWSVIGGDQLLQRDNSFNIDNGLLQKNSYVNKLDMFCGIFTAKDGGAQISYMARGMFSLKAISSPGILKKIINSGTVLNSDIYEIDDQVYYEIVTDGGSFVYNFNQDSWSESTQARQQVVEIKNIYYAANNDSIYEIDLYKNDQEKIRKTPFLAESKLIRPFTLGHTRFFYSNKNLEKGNVYIGGTQDGINYVVEHKASCDGSKPFAVASRIFNLDCYKVAFMLRTKLNVIWQYVTCQATVNQGAQ